MLETLLGTIAYLRMNSYLCYSLFLNGSEWFLKLEVSLRKTLKLCLE